MKKNWLGVLIGVFGAFLSSSALSLGLGDITTESALNEPLIAEIELINVGDLENSQILVGIGTDSDYELAGVAREFFHSDLQFEVQAEGVGQPRILVRTRQPLQDPYLNFIVQVRWPQGKLLREYTLLLDMPVFSRQEVGNTAPTQTQTSAPTTAREAVAQQARQTSQQPTTTRAVSNQRVTTSAPSNIRDGQSYQISSGDTLWGLAGDVATSTGITRHQAMLSIHEQNPDAFVNGDINRLRAGVEIRVPSQAQMSSRTEGQAVRALSSMTPETEATAIQSTSGAIDRNGGNDSATQGGRLALTSGADATDSVAQATNAGAAADESVAAAQELADQALTAAITENAALKEELDASVIERQELEARLANLEEQISLLQEERALQLESNTLSAVEEVAVPAPVAEPEPQPETLMDKLYAMRIWIFGILGIIVVIALLIALLVLKKRKSSEVDELYYDDEEPALEEDDDEYFDEEEEDDLEEGIDEITKDLPEEDEEDELDELEEEDEPEDAEDEDEDLLEDDNTVFATSFDEAEEDDGLESEVSEEFEDLDEFFSDDSSGATEVLFGSDSKDEGEAEEDSAEPAAEEESEAADDELLDFDIGDLSDAVSETDEDEAPAQSDDENSLDFEIGDMAIGDQAPKAEEGEIDLEDKFGFTEPGLTDDLDPDAEADFEESIEVHSSEMGELLVPDELEGSEEDQLFDGESPDADTDGLEDFGEEVEDEAESLLDDEVQEEASDDSLLEVDEDLNLDEDMDADLDDLDLGEEELDAADSDEEFLTKLELAEAYIEMGDVQGAKELLSEVEKDGNAEQQAAAKSMLEGLKG